MKISTILLLLSFVGSSSLYAQDRTIEGIISYGEAPIKGIKISVAGSDKSTLSDEKGYYKINLSPNQKTVIVSSKGIVSQYIELKKKQNKLDVKLEIADEDIARSKGLINFVTRTNSKETIAMDHSAGRLDLKTMIEGKMAGVKYENGYVYMRTEACEYYSIDGTRIENLANINPDDISEIQIVRDGTANIYGGKARYGAVLITTKAYKK